MTGIRELGAAELDGWDAAAVDAPGGHVLQSRAWAEHRAGSGWEPRYLAYPGGLRLPRIMADVSALVAGGYTKIFRK